MRKPGNDPSCDLDRFGCHQGGRQSTSEFQTRMIVWGTAPCGDKSPTILARMVNFCRSLALQGKTIVPADG